jgi:hypothetical protein
MWHNTVTEILRSVSSCAAAASAKLMIRVVFRSHYIYCELVLLAFLFLLKQAPGTAIAAILPFGLPLVLLTQCRKTFLKAFNDVGLLQMSL